MAARRVISVLGTMLLAAQLSPPLPAQIRSAKGPLVKDEVARVSLKNAGLVIHGYRFVRPARIMQKNPFGDGGPSLQVDISNEGTTSEDFGVVVALFDREGRLVGAGTGDHTGKLDPGESVQVKVPFKDVNQDAHLATSLQISLELRR